MIACLPAREQERILTEHRAAEHRLDLARGATFAGVFLITGLAHLGLRRLFARASREATFGRIHLGTGLVAFLLLASLYLVVGLGELSAELLAADPWGMGQMGKTLPYGLAALTVWLVYLLVLIVELGRAHPDELRRVVARLRPAERSF